MTNRPRDRRAQLVAAAADQFHRVGYHGVGNRDIAAAVGITAGALYRHFRSKQELLGEVILDRVERLEGAFTAAEAGPIAGITRALTAHGLDYRDSAVLWQREARHLPLPERDKLRHRVRELAARMRTRIQQERPELTDHQAELLTWSIFGVVASPSHHTIELPRPRFEEILATAADAVLQAPLSTPAEPAGVAAPRTSFLGRASRREALLDAAVELFARDGFARVTMEEIGAAVGMAGPSIYNHFTGKPEMLEAAISRATQLIQFQYTHVLNTARTPQEASNGLLRDYIGFAVPHHALVEVLISEAHHLPEEARHAARRAQHEFVSDWIQLLRHDRPDLDPTELRALVLAEFTIINSTARTPHLTARPELPDDLLSICSAIQRV